MADVLAEWSDFSGGHWGALGPAKAKPNQWGGYNMLPTRQGGLAPVNASRKLDLNATINGKVWGPHWAWGADGRVYYVQQAGTQTSVSRLYRFSPDPASLPNAIATTTSYSFVPTTDPDWVNVGTTVYVTFYGQKSYAINTATNAASLLTGAYGDAPAGRCMCLYGERLLVGGISDARFGVHANRIHFSGDDTGNDPTVRTAWEDLNFFDIGASNSFICGLYTIRDFVVAVTEDQQMWLLTGTPGSTLSARRVYGFNKASGGLASFLPTHAQVDPSQTKLWMFDHAVRAPVRFNGASISRLATFGVARSDREGDDVAEGALTMIGGPDEFIAYGVAVPRSAGAHTAAGTAGDAFMLERLGGVYSLHEKQIVGEQPSPSEDALAQLKAAVLAMGPAFWVNADDAATITSSGTLVSQWNDISGNARHLTQSTDNNKFKTGTRTQNGLNVMDSDAVSAQQDYMTSTSFNLTSPKQVFMVLAHDTGTGSFGGSIVFANGGGAVAMTIGINEGASGVWYMAADGGNALTTAVCGTAAHVVNVTFNGASSVFRVDGVTQTLNANPGSGTSTNGVSLGVAVNPWDGIIAECIVFTGTLTSTQQATAEAYLAAKWGISI